MVEGKQRTSKQEKLMNNNDNLDFLIMNNMDLISVLSRDYQSKGKTRWVRADLEASFIPAGIEGLIRIGYLAKYEDGTVALSHSVPGTLAHKVRNFKKKDLTEMHEYKTLFPDTRLAS
jgi:hypothetical protein